jgi:hypothetical protein
MARERDGETVSGLSARSIRQQDLRIAPDLVQDRSALRVRAGEALASYLVQAQHPETGETAEESFAHIDDAIARAAELIRAGYSVEIRSAASPAS